MVNSFEKIIYKITGASTLRKIEDIQALWSGYGKISRYCFSDDDSSTLIIKQVTLPDERCHPRGWNTPRSHLRKIKSYHVEAKWYESYSRQCNDRCRVPLCLGVDTSDDQFCIVLEDLDAAGYSLRKSTASLTDMKVCLSWLANFHAIFMGRSPDHLWTIGTYWHLETRPDELEVLSDDELRAQAAVIDKTLSDSPFQTFVHGDAKLANFCFTMDSSQVAAVDFQYVGGGCGMKDVAYFIGSCLPEEECESLVGVLLDYYFAELASALTQHDVVENPIDVEKHWRPLFEFAWADFQRFLKGWSPDHWKIHGYSEQVTRNVLDRLRSGSEYKC